MNGVLVARSVYFYGYRYIPLLYSNEPTDFKRSYLWRPENKMVRGDKDVSHRKMSGTVTPIDITGFPYPWSYSEDWWDGGYHRVLKVQGGTRVATFTWHQYSTRWRENHNEAVEMKFVDDGDIVRVYERISWIETVGAEDADVQSFGDWYDSGTYYNKSSQSWNYGRSYRGYNVTYQILNPLPYYWLDYMDSIRPPYNTGIAAGALSEVIRNTISEHTTYATNTYANALEVAELINDFRKGKLVELIDNCKDIYKNILKGLAKNPDNVDVLSKAGLIGQLDVIDTNPEMVDFAKFNEKLRIGGRNARTIAKKSSQTAADGWLKYRYVYNTTKADVEQYTRAKIGEYWKGLDFDQVLRGSIDIPDGTLKVKMRLRDNQSPNLDYFFIGLDQAGLFPGLYNVWDLIPYSFIADWFSNLGDVLQDIDQSIYFRYYEVDEILVSYKQKISRQESWGLTDYTWYDRFILDEMPQWEIYEDNETKATTVRKRTVDAMSLVVEAL